MSNPLTPSRLALVYAGDRSARQTATPENSRFPKLFEAFSALGVAVQPAVYHDDFCGEVRAQLMQMDGVLVWVNPIEGGRDRTQLDALLREVAAAGIYVSTHPDVILKLGTKEVLVQTRHMGWGVEDTQQHMTVDALRHTLRAQLAAGKARVLKQYRGNGGNGVWKVESAAASATSPAAQMSVRVRHAQRGSVDETMLLDVFLARCELYFENGGRMINQAYQTRLPEGMVRCYLVLDKVAGFGLQAVNALCPASAGAALGAVPGTGTDAVPGAVPCVVPATTPRLYHPPTLPQCQPLKHLLEAEWVPQLRREFKIDSTSLPVIWDCDFLLGPKTLSGDDTYVLCEINVSCVSPFPDAAIDVLARATLERVQAATRHAP